MDVTVCVVDGLVTGYECDKFSKNYTVVQPRDIPYDKNIYQVTFN